jgi:hypothetical protein
MSSISYKNCFKQLLVGRVSNRIPNLFIWLMLFSKVANAIYLNKEDLNPDLNFYGFEISGNRGVTLSGMEYF